MLPPAYLYSLEGTPVMSGLDSISLWQKFLEDRSIHRDWLKHGTSGSGSAFEKVKSLHNKFASFVLTKVFEQKKTFKIQLPLEVYLFGVTRSCLSDDMVGIFERNSSCLMGKGIIVPRFSPKNIKQVFELLVHFNIYSTIVTLNLQRIPDNCLSQLCSPNFSTVLIDFFLQSSVQYLSLSFSCSPSERKYTPLIECIFSGIAQNCYLKELKLIGIGPVALFTVEPYLSIHCKCLSKIDIDVKSSSVNVAQALVSMVSNQSCLKELRLSLKRVYFGESRNMFSKGLANVFKCPQIESVNVNGPCDLDVHRVISSFLKCSTSAVCKLTLSDIDVRVYDTYGVDISTTYALPTRECMMENGSLKSLCFSRLSFESSLLDWLFSMESIRLRGLAFEHCQVIDMPRIRIIDYLEQHSDFFVHKYEEV